MIIVNIAHNSSTGGGSGGWMQVRAEESSAVLKLTAQRIPATFPRAPESHSDTANLCCLRTWAEGAHGPGRRDPPDPAPVLELFLAFTSLLVSPLNPCCGYCRRAFYMELYYFTVFTKKRLSAEVGAGWLKPGAHGCVPRRLCAAPCQP